MLFKKCNLCTYLHTVEEIVIKRVFYQQLLKPFVPYVVAILFC